jgi:hypothetical protein
MYIVNNKEHGMKSEYTLQLSSKQARLLSIAIQQEIVKGSSTFLSGRDVIDLGKILDQIHAQSISITVGQQFMKESV